MAELRNRIGVFLPHLNWKRLAGERPFYIFGSGEAGKLLFEYLQVVEIFPEGIVDNDQKKWGNDFAELKISNPQSLHPGVFVIIASSWYPEIAQQLEDFGLQKGVDFVDDYPVWFEALGRYRFTRQVEIHVENEVGTQKSIPISGCLPENAVKSTRPEWDQDKADRLEQVTCFFIHNSMHAGDIVLTRPFIQELKRIFPKVKIILECSANRAYLWEDLKLPMFIYDGKEYRGTQPTANCPKDAIFINIWFGVFQELLDEYGLSFANNVHTFNRMMFQYNLQNYFQMAVKSRIPMVEFYRNVKLPFGVQKNGILVENGQVFSGQSDFDLNAQLPELAQSFPNLNFYLAAPVQFYSPNVIDCSQLDLIELSELSNRCVAFLTLGSGVNAAAQTENNRYKHRCIVGWKYPWQVWCNPENPVFFADNRDMIKKFLVMVSETLPTKALLTLGLNELGPTGKKFGKFLGARSEVDQCTRYLHENGLVSHSVVCKDWEIAHIIADLPDGALLDMGSSDSYILKNAVIKGIKGEKYGIDLRTPNVPLAGVKYLIGDLMAVPLPDQSFQNITCLSVLEHQVDIPRFAKEVSRLLQSGGSLYVTFDYWDPKVVAPVQLFGLDWDIFDRNDVDRLTAACQRQGLDLTETIDWKAPQPLINREYWAPADIGYTFGMLKFRKQ